TAKMAKPAGTTEKALADWVAAIGGKSVPATGRIREISLAGARVGDAQVDFLQAAAATLEKLNLEATEVGDLGLQKLQRLKNLKELNLAYTPISDSGLKHLAVLANLRVLKIGGTQVTGSGLADLAPLNHLAELDLTGSPITPEGLAAMPALA